jgi:hypothetical protein
MLVKRMKEIIENGLSIQYEFNATNLISFDPGSLKLNLNPDRHFGH